jgi:hypothetical protein
MGLVSTVSAHQNGQSMAFQPFMGLVSMVSVHQNGGAMSSPPFMELVSIVAVHQNGASMPSPRFMVLLSIVSAQQNGVSKPSFIRVQRQPDKVIYGKAVSKTMTTQKTQFSYILLWCIYMLHVHCTSKLASHFPFSLHISNLFSVRLE